MNSPRRHKHGLTLIEVITALALALVIVIGVIYFRFYSAKAGTRAEFYTVAARVGDNILKTWRSSGQLDAFNPVDTLSGEDVYFTIDTFGSGLSIPEDMTLVDHYQVTSGNHHFIATLAYQDATSAAPALRSVGVGFRNDYQAGALGNSKNVIWLSLY